MKKIALVSFLLLIAVYMHAQWSPDNGDGTYKNPIIHADYSDPDVIRVGDDYWMVASSFTCMPGIPLLHSHDLVNWKIVNHIYDRLPLQKYDHPVHGQGSWAPSIRHHEGMFYVYFCTPHDGLFVARATDPLGKWDLKHIVDVEKWEDPCPFWDEDGQAYLAHSIHRGGPAIIHKMSWDGLQLLDNGKVVYHDIEVNPILEGLKMTKRNGWYYIFAPAGGVAHGWQTVLRSKTSMGRTSLEKCSKQATVSTDLIREDWSKPRQANGGLSISSPKGYMAESPISNPPAGQRITGLSLAKIRTGMVSALPY